MWKRECFLELERMLGLSLAVAVARRLPSAAQVGPMPLFDPEEGVRGLVQNFRLDKLQRTVTVQRRYCTLISHRTGMYLCAYKLERDPNEIMP